MSDTATDAQQPNESTPEADTAGDRGDDRQQENDEKQASPAEASPASAKETTDQDGTGGRDDDRDREDLDGDEDDDSSEDDADDGDDDEPEESPKLKKALRKKNSENRNLRERLRATERKLSQREAADATGLPPELADRLQGDTAEELKADAEKLIESFHLNGGFVPGLGVRGGDRHDGADATADDVTDLAAIGQRIYER